MNQFRAVFLIAVLTGMFCCIFVAYAGATGSTFAGNVHTFSIQSQTLDQEREILVALPQGYDESGDRYPVLYVLDAGWHFLSTVSAVRFLSETSYISAHRIPPVIVIGIVNRDRNEDNTPTQCVSQHGMSFPTSGRADRFLTFISGELIPQVDQRYRTYPYRVLAGWSFGGLLTMHALLERPDIFRGHLAISPSLWWDDELLVTRATELARSGERRERDLVLTIGTAEEGGLCFKAVHKLIEKWETAPLDGLSLSFLEIPGEDHNHSPYKAYFDGLRALFADWFYPEDAFATGLESLQAHYDSLSVRRGYDIDVPGHMYKALMRALLADDRPAEAVAVMQEQCVRNPCSPLIYFELGEVCRKVDHKEQARDAYLHALELERALSSPDTVFINWVEGVISNLEVND